MALLVDIFGYHKGRKEEDQKKQDKDQERKREKRKEGRRKGKRRLGSLVLKLKFLFLEDLKVTKVSMCFFMPNIVV